LGSLPALAFLPSCNPSIESTSSSSISKKEKNQKIDYDLNNPKDQLLIFEKL